MRVQSFGQLSDVELLCCCGQMQTCFPRLSLVTLLYSYSMEQAYSCSAFARLLSNNQPAITETLVATVARALPVRIGDSFALQNYRPLSQKSPDLSHVGRIPVVQAGLGQQLFLYRRFCVYRLTTHLGGQVTRTVRKQAKDYSQVVKVQDRVYGRQNELICGLLGFAGVLRVHIRFYGSLRSLWVFLGVVSAFATTTGDVLPLPVRWPYLPYSLDDRALLRHIHPIPPP